MNRVHQCLALSGAPRERATSALSAHPILPPTWGGLGPFCGGSHRGTEQQGPWEQRGGSEQGCSLHLPAVRGWGAEGNARGWRPEPGSRFRPGPQPPLPLAAAAGGPSLRRLAFHLRIFHAGLAWRRAVCGPHKGRRVLHSSRWGPAGEGPAAWRGARPARGGCTRRGLACALQTGPPSQDAAGRIPHS